ncbi:hypothetical protein RA27_16405 [Ruegeria sp. ANG-R]|nr:hypothetical protein RA27_16405 [Ruegeria sp. ANG-R]
MIIQSVDLEAAIDAEVPVSEAAIHDLLETEETREILASVGKDTYLNLYSHTEEWRVCQKVARMAERLDHSPKNGWGSTFEQWLAIPVIAIARRILVEGNGFIESPWSKVILKDAVIPRRFFYETDGVRLRIDIDRFFLGRPRHLSTLIAPWIAYAATPEFFENSKVFEPDDYIYDEAGMSAVKDSIYSHFVHFGVIPGSENLAHIPHLMAKRGVYVTDPQSIRSSIAATENWRNKFSEFR